MPSLEFIGRTRHRRAASGAFAVVGFCVFCSTVAGAEASIAQQTNLSTAEQPAIAQKVATEQAVPVLPAVNVTQPDSQAAIAAYNQGNTLAEQGNIAAAITAFQKATQLNPQNANAHYNLGYWLASQDQFEAAEIAYWQASRLSPFDAEIYYNLGLVLQAQNKTTAAEVAFERSQLLSHNNTQLQQTLSTLLSQ